MSKDTVKEAAGFWVNMFMSFIAAGIIGIIVTVIFSAIGGIVIGIIAGILTFIIVPIFIVRSLRKKK